WAEVALDFHPDAFQTEIMTETNPRIMILGPRQTGKSTATAVRVLYEAMSHDDAVILLASASGRQSGQIMDKARKMARSVDLTILPPPPKCDGFSLANGSQVISLPDSEETIRGFSAPRLIVVDEAAFASPEVFKALEPMLTVSAGTIMLLSTPNGQSGYFYDQWHAALSPWTRLLGSLERCPRINRAAIDAMRQTMSKEDFQQEFECKFVAAGGQFIARETFRKCLRDDFDLFFPEYDLEGIE
ncbi:MAG: terminase large subunit domain-containing protein, partial [Bryobacteraceae bacterium]